MNETIKIVAVDDEEMFLLPLVHLLHSQGYQVEKALTGQQGLEKVKTFSPDVLILDWHLTDFDGVGLAQRIKSNPDFKHIFIMMLSNSIHTEEIVQAFDAGVDEYLIKPYAREELLARIRAGVRLRRALTSELKQERSAMQELEIDRLQHFLSSIKQSCEILNGDEKILTCDSYLNELPKLSSAITEMEKILDHTEQKIQKSS